MTAGLFGLFLPWISESAYPAWPWVISGVAVCWALIAPNTLNPVYRIWMRFGLMLNKITTPVIMGAVFFAIISPYGCFLRITGKDPLKKSCDKSANSDRVASQNPASTNLEKPF